MNEGFFSSPRREEGANRDSQPRSNAGIGKKTRSVKYIAAKRLDFHGSLKNQNLSSAWRATLAAAIAPPSIGRRRALGLLAFAPALAAAVPTPSRRVRFLSYNIHHGEGLDGKLDLPRIARAIRETKADWIALQEVDDATTRTGKVKQAEELARLCGKRAFFAKAMDHAGGGYGNAILYPDDGQEYQTRRIPLDAGRGEPRVAAMVSTAGPGGRPCWFVSLHLDHREKETRARQLAMLRQAMPPEDAVLLAGDFNAERPESLLLLPAPWRHLDKSAPSATHPANQPASEIDHMVWRASAGLDIAVADHHVVAEAVASDHRPILLEATWVTR